MAKFNKKNYDKKTYFKKKRQKEEEQHRKKDGPPVAVTDNSSSSGRKKCDHPVCVQQRNMTPLPDPKLLYVIYNNCVDCGTYWPKEMNRCGHCQKILKTRSPYHREESERERFSYTAFDG